MRNELAWLIETPRLAMRHFTIEDAASVFAFNSDPKVLRYLGEADKTCSLEEAETVIKDIWLREYQQYGYARYALVHKHDKQVIGFCGFKFEVDEGYPDIGYRIMPKYWNRGLVSEACSALMPYGRNELGLEKVIAMAAVDNIASNRIIQRLGFNRVARFEHAGMPHYRYQNW